MTEVKRNIALIVAAGRGERSGGGVPKQFRKVAGKSLIAHAIYAFSSHSGIDDIILVIAEGQEDDVKAALGDIPVPQCVHGGTTRQASVRAGLEYIAAEGSADRVLIHDAARPFLPHSVIDRLL
ncbi:MAG: 2-C-methyl-D-erythritol 4-phosphate cytidylyltransferase, partial [Alphaproteobacteria bacterium]|nr:2-C-methyl-D-erythritol 4-phosphate cytidylyltransferase [Alphaproteobacteria bacterium]